MKRSIRSNERDRLRVLMNLVRQSRDFHAYNSVTIRKELTRSIKFVKPRSID